MTTPSRRRFLTGSVVALAGLAGTTNAQPIDAAVAGSSAQIDEDATAALELLPAASELDAEYMTVVRSKIDADDEDDLGYETRMAFEAIEELDVADVTTVASVHVADPGRRVAVATGSFDRLDPGEEIDEDGDWRLAEDGQHAFASAEGRVVVAATGDADQRRTIVETAVDAARGDADSVLDDPGHVRDAFERLADQAIVYVVPEADGRPFPVTEEPLSAFAAGFEVPPSEIRGLDGTVENEHLLYLEDESLDEPTLDDIVAELEPGKVVEREVETDDDVVHVSVVVEAPPQRDREAAPEARIRTEVDDEDGTLAFEHTDGEAIDASMLELWENGDLAGTQPVDEFDAFAPEDVLTVDTDPLATFTLRWFDEDENAYYDYATVVVGEDAFEVDHDVDDETVELTYVGERPADPDELRLTHRSEGAVDASTDALDAIDGDLEPGDVLTVEDVELGDRIRLELDVPRRSVGHSTTLVRYHARPPRVFLHSNGDGTVLASYHGRQERDADAFRILVEDEPADVQFADEYDTLEHTADLEVGEFAFGTELRVEWTDPEEPIEVGELVVVPRAHVATEYDDADGTLTLVHEDGDELEADRLELRVAGDPASDQVADEHDTFGPEDEFTADVEPFTVVELVWREDDVEEVLDHAITGEGSIEASYEPDDDAVELTYVGERPADPSRLELRRRGPGTPGEDDESSPFEAYDTLTEGDSVVLEDVHHDEQIEVVLVPEDDEDDGDDGSDALSPHRHHRPIVRFTPRPRWAFRIEERAESVVAVYREEIARDADHFRVLADGEATEVQPADEHDTLDRDDEIDLGSISTGTELVIEWTVPDDPVEVTDHVVVPSAEFEFERDEDTVTVEHVGGDEFDAEDLMVVVLPQEDPEYPDAWAEAYDTVEDGDAITVEYDGEADEQIRMAGVVFDRTEMLDHREFPSDEAADDTESGSASASAPVAVADDGGSR